MLFLYLSKKGAALDSRLRNLCYVKPMDTTCNGFRSRYLYRIGHSINMIIQWHAE